MTSLGMQKQLEAQKILNLGLDEDTIYPNFYGDKLRIVRPSMRTDVMWMTKNELIGLINEALKEGFIKKEEIE